MNNDDDDLIRRAVDAVRAPEASMHPQTPCPGCVRLERQNAALRAEIDYLTSMAPEDLVAARDAYVRAAQALAEQTLAVRGTRRFPSNIVQDTPDPLEES